MTNNDSNPRPVEGAVKPALTPKRFAWNTIIIAILAALTIVGILWWDRVSQYRNARIYWTFQECQSNLRTIDGAKEAWALEHSKTRDAKPALEDLRPYFFGSGMNLPSCPDGGRYILGNLGEKPKCSLGGRHALP